MHPFYHTKLGVVLYRRESEGEVNHCYLSRSSLRSGTSRIPLYFVELACCTHTHTHSDFQNMKRSEDCKEELESDKVGVADPPVAMEGVGVSTATQAPPSVEGMEEGDPEEEEGVWSSAQKKYQEFQEACRDILDPG